MNSHPLFFKILSENKIPLFKEIAKKKTQEEAERKRQIKERRRAEQEAKAAEDERQRILEQKRQAEAEMKKAKEAAKKAEAERKDAERKAKEAHGTLSIVVRMSGCESYRLSARNPVSQCSEKVIRHICSARGETVCAAEC